MAKKQKRTEDRTTRITRCALIILSTIAGWAADRAEHPQTPVAQTIAPGNLTVVVRLDHEGSVTHETVTEGD